MTKLITDKSQSSTSDAILKTKYPKEAIT